MIFGDGGFSVRKQLFGTMALVGLVVGSGATAVAGVSQPVRISESESSETFTYPEPFYVKTQKGETTSTKSHQQILTTQLNFRFGWSAGEGMGQIVRNANTVMSSQSGDTLVVSGLFSEGDGPRTLRITPSSPYDGNAGIVQLRIELLSASGEILSAPSMVVKFGEKASFVEKFPSILGAESVLAVDVVVKPE